MVFFQKNSQNSVTKSCAKSTYMTRYPQCLQAFMYPIGKDKNNIYTKEGGEL